MKNINIRGTVEVHRTMADLTTFKVGGPADIFASPLDGDDVIQLVTWAEQFNIAWTVIGGGANILVSDKGIRGLVISTLEMNSISIEDTELIVGAGADISAASAYAADNGLAGLEFIYSMPGSTGGAVWMNARCYGSEISEVLSRVDYLDAASKSLKSMDPQPSDFAYKISPFQNNGSVILESRFNLKPGDSGELWKVMKENQRDRTQKGHFAAPCAGSVFKNNRDFGAPSGKIIDSLNLRGTSIGGAKVSDGHANIIINNGNATAADIGELIDLVQNRVQDELGFRLEPEVLRLGDWT